MPGGELAEFRLRNLQVGQQLARVRDTEDHVGLGNALTQLDLPRRDNAANRRPDPRVFEIQTRQLVGGLERFDVILQAFEHRLADQPACGKVRVALVLAADLLQVRFRRQHLQPESLSIEFGKDLALRHAVAFLDEQPYDLTADLGDHRGVGIGCYRGRRLVGREDIGTRWQRRFHRDRRGCFDLTVRGDARFPDSAAGRQGGYEREHQRDGDDVSEVHFAGHRCQFQCCS